jgi:hypothetical protein
VIEKGLITQEEFMQKISEERATYQKLLNPAPAMNIGEILIWESSNLLLLIPVVMQLGDAGAP